MTKVVIFDGTLNPCPECGRRIEHIDPIYPVRSRSFLGRATFTPGPQAPTGYTLGPCGHTVDEVEYRNQTVAPHGQPNADPDLTD
ncbi:MAG TPA: hypothetical protein VGW74_10610 [Propionibacteriaceae bacterium]|nr:hypothetical protein [Propionibacteriaceae bacterium]